MLAAICCRNVLHIGRVWGTYSSCRRLSRTSDEVTKTAPHLCYLPLFQFGAGWSCVLIMDINYNITQTANKASEKGIEYLSPSVTVFQVRVKWILCTSDPTEKVNEIDGEW